VQVLRYDVNLSILFTELPLFERPAAAAASGFDAAELWWPFAEPVPPDRELTELQRAFEDSGVQLVGLNFDAGDVASGDRGLLSLPEQSARFRANIDVAVGLAEATGCRTLNALYGNRVDVRPEAQDELAVENLALAAKAAERIDAVVVVEALNSYDAPRYPLTSTADALAVIERVSAAGATNVRFLADLYHLARMGEDPVEVVKTHVADFGHVQIADAPGRHQPGTGDIPFDRVFEALLEGGYAGSVGLEYEPLGPSAQSFDWLPVDSRRSTTSTVSAPR
jgi:hydroxypyruvate isomerase